MTVTPLSEFVFKIPKNVFDRQTKTLIAIYRGRSYTEIAFVPRDLQGSTFAHYAVNFQIYANKDFEESIRYLCTYSKMPIEGTIRLTGECCENYKSVVEDITALKVEIVKLSAAAERGLHLITSTSTYNSWFYEETRGYPVNLHTLEMQKCLKHMETIFVRHDAINPNAAFPCVYTHVGSETKNMVINENGVCKVHIDSVIGGKTLLGLAHLILGTSGYSELDKISEDGLCSNVNTTVGEVVKDDPSSLFSKFPQDFGLIPFGKFADTNFEKHSCKQKDLAAGLLNLVASYLGQAIASTMLVEGVSRVYMSGQAVGIKLMRVFIIEYMRLYVKPAGKINFLKVNPAPLGAIYMKSQKST